MNLQAARKTFDEPRQLGNLTFNEEIGEYSSYSVILNEIQFEKKKALKGFEGTTRIAIHELGHAIEKKVKKGSLGEKLLSLLDDITKKDENGNYLYAQHGKTIVRIGKFAVPDLYALKESKDSLGNRSGVELLSTFFQQIYIKPWLLQVPKYQDYYQRILDCIKITLEESKENIK